MKVPNIALKTIIYCTLSVPLAVSAGVVRADETVEKADEALRTEVKAALSPADGEADRAAESVGDDIAAEIIASGLNTLKQGMAPPSRPGKVVAMKLVADGASGQADQT